MLLHPAFHADGDPIGIEGLMILDYLGNDVTYFTMPEYGIFAGNYPNTSPNNVGWLFMDNNIPVNPNYEVKIQIEDAGGRLSQIWAAVITVTT